MDTSPLPSPGHSASLPAVHVSVMPDEIVHWVTERHPRVVIDGTFGAGGHARLILRRMSDQATAERSGGAHDSPAKEPLLIGMDRDPAVSERADREVADDRMEVFLGSYEKAPAALQHFDLTHTDAILLDLGLSSDQLADRRRGFSFNSDGELDLRFDPESGLAAWQWLAQNTESAIADAIYQFGEERRSRRIARAIVQAAKRREPVTSVTQMVEICRRCVPRSRNHDIHPATRTFQALRIVVNEELDILRRTLQQAPDWIASGGRAVVISFHSLEDRIVKNAFRDDDRWRILTKKPLRPSEEEVRQNPRSRSAKLRVAERI